MTLSAEDPPFYALLFALIRKADTSNMEKIAREWPDVVAEFKMRYNLPGGLLPGE
jgi:hypothetical protein